MRKIIILIMCFAMVGTSIIASAAEVTPRNGDSGLAPIVLNGKWKMNDTIDVDTLSTFSDLNIDSFYFYDNNSIYQKLWVDSYGVWSILNPFNDAREETIYLYNDEDDCWNVAITHYWSFQGVVVPSEFLIWLNDNGTEILCDGSVCPVGDSNNDNYCEDCHARMVKSPENPDNEGVTNGLPPLPSEVTEDYKEGILEYIIMNYNGEISLYAYYTNQGDDSYYVWGNSYDNNVTLEATDAFSSANKYVLSSGEWQFVTQPLSGDYIIGKLENIVSSSVAIYDENGKLFFPLTLWEQILKVTQGEMKIQIPKLDSSIHLLTICGIGLMALVISYLILKKILYKFL